MEVNNKCKMSAVSKIMAARQKNAGTWGVNANIVKNIRVLFVFIFIRYYMLVQEQLSTIRHLILIFGTQWF